MKKAAVAQWRTWIEIDRAALRHNYRIFRRLLGRDCLYMAVVKSNAYGHGLLDSSRAIAEAGADWLGVDSVVEAESLRRAGATKPILVLGYTLPEKVIDAAALGVSITVADLASLKNLKQLVVRGPKLRIHLKIDTGMHRQGFSLSELKAVIPLLKSLSRVSVEGVYTHFASAKNPTLPATTLEQLALFHKAVALLEEAGFTGLIKHAAATAGALAFPSSRLDMVRVGIGGYGLWPSPQIRAACRDTVRLRPVLSWKAVVSQIKNLPKGARLGYDLTATLARVSRIAVLPIGYWHGFPRVLSGLGRVLIRGGEARVLGRVSMDMISVDVTDIKEAKIGDEAVLIGRSGSAEIFADDAAALSDTVNYEIVTRLNPLIKRIVV